MRIVNVTANLLISLQSSNDFNIFRQFFFAAWPPGHKQLPHQDGHLTPCEAVESCWKLRSAEVLRQTDRNCLGCEL